MKMKLFLVTALMLLVVILPLAQACNNTPATTAAPPSSTAAPKTTPASSPTPTPSAKPTTSPTAALKPQTLTIARTDLGLEVWTLTKGTAVEASTIANANESLVNRKPGTLTLVPGLADSWTSSADAKTWTFNIHKGIQWQEGYGEFTSEDVKFSLDLASSKDSLNNNAGWIRNTIDSVDTSDPYKAVIKLKKADISVPYILANYTGYTYMMSKKYVEKVGVDVAQKHPVGTGPWHFVESKQGDYVKFEAVKNHWRKTPAFDFLVIKKVPEESTRVAMLRAGQADIIEMSPQSKKEIQGVAGLKVNRVPGGAFVYTFLGGQALPTRPTYDPKVPWAQADAAKALKVRQAMNLAVNKQAIIDRILLGEAEQMFVGSAATSPDAPWMDPRFTPYPYDQAKAKQLLAEAGYAAGFEMTVWEFPAPTVPYASDVMEAVAMDWEKIGIKVKREMTSWDSIRKHWPDRSLAWYSYTYKFGANDEPQSMVWRSMHSSAAINHGFESAQLDELAQKAVSEPDFQKRSQINKEINALLYDTYEFVPIGATNVIYGVNDRIGDWPQVRGYDHAHFMEYITFGPAVK